MSSFMQNLNGNLPCAIAIRTTGPSHKDHDIVEVVAIPLTTDLLPVKETMPLLLDIAPTRPESFDNKLGEVTKERLCDLIIKGVDQWRAADMFADWVELQRKRLALNKKLMPICYNWPRTSLFLYEWLGPATYEMCFNSAYRDILSVSTFVNDRAGWLNRDFVYPKVDLGYLCSQLSLERYDPKSALDNARVTAEIYRRMIKEFV